MPEVVRMGNEGEPLTPTEKKLLERLLGDPGNLPGAFKSWVPKHLETNPPFLPFEELAFRRPRLLAQDDASDGEIMAWSDSAGQWQPSAATVTLANIEQGGAATGDLLGWDGSAWNDLSLSLATDDVLKWNGSVWTAAVVGYDELSGTPTLVEEISDLDDVATAGVGTGDLLRYNGSNWVDWEVPACLAQNTGTHSHTSSGNWQIVNCPSTDEYDNDAMHSTSTNNDRITPNTPGVYACSWACQWAVHATGSRFISLTKNGGITYQIGPLSHATHAVRMTVYGNFYMNGTTDYMGIQAYQETGGTTTMTGVKFSAHWVSHGF